MRSAAPARPRPLRRISTPDMDLSVDDKHLVFSHLARGLRDHTVSPAARVWRKGALMPRLPAPELDGLFKRLSDEALIGDALRRGFRLDRGQQRLR